MPGWITRENDGMYSGPDDVREGTTHRDKETNMTTDTTLRGGVFTITRIMLPVLLVLTLLTAVPPGPAHGQDSPPAAPTGLTAPVVSHDSVQLSWDDPSDSSIEGYQILRRDVVNQPPGTFSTVENDTASRSTTYTDGTVEPDTHYAYRIKARNTAGLSGQSNYVNVTTLEAPSEPSPPTGLTAPVVSHDSVQLSWDDPSDSSIKGYQILRRDMVNQPPGTFSTVENDTASRSTTYTDETVAPDTRYAYRIKARNGAGLSGQSNYVNVTTLEAPSEPSPPPVVVPQQSESNDATLSVLTVDGTSVPGFDADRMSYQYGVAHSVSQVTIGATTTHNAATFSYSTTDADSGTDGHQLALSAGRNAITVTVTAEDGHTTAEYTVSVNRGVNSEFGWKASDDFDTLIAAGNDSPTGIWSNSTTMWVVEGSDDKLYAYNLSTKARDSSKDFDTLTTAGNEDPTGIWSDGTTMWVADSDDTKLFAYNLSTKARDSAKDFDNLAAAGNETPTGIWSNGTTMWAVDLFDKKLFAYNLSTKARDSAKDFDTLDAAGNETPTGIWSDGTTMWVLDTIDKKIYAYNRSTKARDSSKDFGTLDAAGNDFPSGIWSNGTTMWVVDATDDKIYSYNMPIQSDDATLSALTVDGTSVPGFDADTTSYQYGVAHSVSQVTIGATTNHSGATVAYSTTDADSGTDGHQLALSAGRNSITVTVTSEDGNTTAEYTVSVNRGVNLAYGWKASDDFDTLIAAENEDPAGLWSNGTTMWAVDLFNTKLFAYNLSTKARDSVKDFNTLAAAGNETPTGTWSDGTTMWVLDTSDRKIYAYNVSTKARDSAKDFDTLAAAGNQTPSSLWSDGTTMWVADFFNATIFAYNLSTKAHDSLKDFNTLAAAGNEDSRGLWSDGTTMWVADPKDGKLYAYNLSTKARDSSRDLDTLRAAGNGQPTGLWSDGATMWVADNTSSKAKIYSYNMPAPRDDATLSALTVNGTSVPGFNADRTSYERGTAHSVSQVTVAATTTDAAATVAYSGTDANSGADGHQLALSAGRNAIRVTVTAEDGTTTEVYTVSVNRGVNTTYGWRAVADFDTLDTAGNDAPYGLWSDSATMWVTDNGDDKIYAYSMTTKARDSGKDFDTLDSAGNGEPGGIWSDGATLWVADSGDDKIYAYNLSTKTRDSGKDFDTPDSAGNDHPVGIWSDGATMWVSDRTDAKIYAYSMSTKARDSAKDFDTLTAAGNGKPGGIWSDGATMWVGDVGDDKIYAYSLSTKERDSGKDFDTLDSAGNDFPVGIWSNGATMWVTDLSDDKIYSYNMDLPAPTNLSATPDSRRVTLRWDGPDNSDIRLFQYRVSANDGSTWSPDWTNIPRSSASTRSYPVTGLTNGTGYTFQVRAEYTRSGRNLAGQESTVTATPQVPPPGQPSNFKATQGDAEVTLTWNNPSNSTITHYQYRHRVSNAPGTAWNLDWTNIPGSGRATTRLTVTHLTNGIEYTFQVRAVNAGGESEAASDTAEPKDSNPPQLNSAVVNATQLTLTYNEPLDGNSVPQPEQYTLSISPSPATAVTVSNVAVSGTKVTLTLSSPVEDIHTVRVTYSLPSTNAVQDPAGNRASRISRRLATNESPLPDPPGTPTDLQATPQGPNRIDLMWSKPSDEGGAAISGYRIEVSTDGSSWTDLVSDTRSTGTTHSHSGLELGDTQRYRVSAINRGGPSTPSAVATATTDERPYLTVTARRVRTDSVPTAVGTLRIPVYEVIIEASQPVISVDGKLHHNVVPGYITNARLFSWGVRVNGDQRGIPTHYTVWRAEVIPDLPEVRGSTTITIELPEGVVEDEQDRRNHPPLPFVLVVNNLPSSDTQRPRTRITYSPHDLVQTGPFTVRIDFREPVSGFEQNEIRVTNSTVSNFSSNQSGSVYTATITPDAPTGENALSISVRVSDGVARDKAGHTNLGDSIGLIARPRPTVDLIIPKANPNPPDRPESDSAYIPESGWFYKSQSAAFEVTVKFSKPVTGFVQEELVVEAYQKADRKCYRAGGANVTGWQSQNGGAEYVATITPTATGIIAISVAQGVAQDQHRYLNLGKGRQFVYMSMPGSDDESCRIEDKE